MLRDTGRSPARCQYLGEGLVHALDVVCLDGEGVIRVEGAAPLHDCANLVPQGHQPAQDMHAHLQDELPESDQRALRTTLHQELDPSEYCFHCRLRVWGTLASVAAVPAAPKAAVLERVLEESLKWTLFETLQTKMPLL